MSSTLSTERLTIGYRRPRHPDVEVARDLDLTLQPGELVCLLGPNGAGKSTLMRTLAGMQPALSGRVLLDGREMQQLSPQDLARRLSVVLTEPVNPGSLRAYDLVALGRYPYTDWVGRLREEDRQVVERSLEAVGAVDLAHRPVSELSDGERQKVLIARALAQEPAVMLLDEPTAFLDLPRRVEVMGVLRTLARETGKSVLLSSHDLDLALRSADIIWLISADGAIRQGAPEDLVLNGAFADTFRSAGVTFDHYSGSFHINRDTAGVVTLQGDGLPALWTTRALEREGFCVQPSDAALHANGAGVMVRVQNGSEPINWTVTLDGQEHRHDTIYAMVRFVKQVGAAGALVVK